MRHWLWRLTAVVALACIPLACWEGEDSTFELSTGPRGLGNSGTNTPVAQTPLGKWTHTDTFATGGARFSTQTIWSFSADGTAQRIVITTDLGTGTSSSDITQAVWSAQGSTLFVQFLPNGPGLTLTFVVSGGTLFLNGVPYQFIE